MASFNEVCEASLEYFGGDELAADVFATKYALVDKNNDYKELTPNKMHSRLAREFARIERNYENPLSEQEIFALFDHFKYLIPQGSPMSGIGNKHQLQSLSNCFCVESPHDSYGGICKTDQELVQIAKRRGGVGFDVSTLRPKGMSTNNCAKTTDGIGVFLERFSNSIREVAQHGRRGACLISCSSRHPEILAFINIKRDKKKVTGANISVRWDDAFFLALESGESYQLRWPVDSATPEYEELIDPKIIWDAFIDAAWSSAEPGAFFWDTILRRTPADIYADQGFKTVSSNPCGELVLSADDSCRLLVLNTKSYVNYNFLAGAAFDWPLFCKLTIIAQRPMDVLIDLELEQLDKIITKIESDPEPADIKRVELNLWHRVKQMASQGRRTGLGLTGIGDAIACMGMRYGSESSVAFVDELYKQLALNAYESSCTLAKERGAFPIYDFGKEAGHQFIEQLIAARPSLGDALKSHGRRNIALLTTAPCGTLSCEAQVTSGIECVFLPVMERFRKLTESDTKIPDRIDDMGDRWEKYVVYHQGLKEWMEITGETDVSKSPYHGATSDDVDWVQKVKLQAAAQKWICHSISVTMNIPNNATRELVDEIYRTGWKLGCKGMTIYREGSRQAVLQRVGADEKVDFISQRAPKRPQELPCDIKFTRIKDENWVVLVGLMNGKPYEVMGGRTELVEIPKTCTTGNLIKNSRKTVPSRYDLKLGENGHAMYLKNIVKLFDNPEHSAFTRVISLALRHGSDIKFVVEQLGKDKDSDMFSFAKSIARALKSYIQDGEDATDKTCQACGAEGLVYMEGCVTCMSCSWSRCG